MIAKTSCQHCGQHIEFEVENAGATVPCPSCGQQTTLLLPSKPATVQPAPVKTNQNLRSTLIIVGTVAGIMVVCLIGFGLSHISRNKPVESEIKIAAVQSNAPVIPKAEPPTAEQTASRENILKPTTEFAKAGPFGFDPGMTKQQIIDELGQNAIKEVKGDVLTLDNAPRPYSGFEEYVLVIDPKRGLVAINVGVDISTSVYGDELKNAFNSMEESIASSYGESTRYDYLRRGSIWNERKDFMMGLIKKERMLESFWPNNDSTKLKGQVTSIYLKAGALSQEKGYLLLHYEFVGYNEYQEEQKNKENQVF